MREKLAIIIVVLGHPRTQRGLDLGIPQRIGSGIPSALGNDLGQPLRGDHPHIRHPILQTAQDAVQHVLQQGVAVGSAVVDQFGEGTEDRDAGEVRYEELPSYNAR